MTACRKIPPQEATDSSRTLTMAKPERCQNPECQVPIKQDAERIRYYCGRRCRGRMNTLGISVSRGDVDAKDLGPSRPMYGMTEAEARQARMRNALSRLREGVPMPLVLDAYPSITEEALKKAASRAKVKAPPRDWLPA